MITTKSAYFGGGCFWCTEAIFKNIRGVLQVTSGYSGGTSLNPTYEEVCSGKSGHAEIVKIDYEPEVITLEKLLAIFFATHDPTSVNRQGNDVGSQYRSIIFYCDQEEKQIVTNFIAQIQSEFDLAIATELKELRDFYPAEDYHQDYYDKNPQFGYCQVVIDPKLQKLKAKFAKLLKN